MICKVTISREEAEALKEYSGGTATEGIHALVEQHILDWELGHERIALHRDLLERYDRAVMWSGLLPTQYIRRVLENHIELLEAAKDSEDDHSIRY